MEQSIQLMDRLSNSAAFGRQSSLSFGEAVSSATEGIKNGNSILVDNAGVTKNLSMMLEEAGFKAQDLMKAGTDAGVRMAIFNGVMKETVGQMGDVEKLSKTSAGSVAKYDAAMFQLKVKFGEFIAKAAIPFLEKATNVLKWLVDASPAMQKLAITLVTLSTAFIVLNRSIGSMPYILISLFGIVVALPPHLKTAAIAIIAFAASMKLLNGNVGSLIGGLTSLRTKGISSISGFATTAVGKLNLIAVAASLLIAWIVLLIEKMNALDDENKNMEHWQKIRDNGGKIYMQTNDEKIDITDPKNPKKTSTFQYNYVPGKGFVGQENSTGVQYGPEIDPEQLELLKQIKKDKEAIDDLSKKTPGSTKTGSDSSDTKEEINRLKELQNQLAEVGKKLELNKGLIGAEIDLLKEKHRIENEITYIQTGIDLDMMIEDNKDVVMNQINDQIELSKLRKEQLQTEMEAQLTAIDEIHKLKIDLIGNEHEKKLAQIEFERKKELEAIEERNLPIEQKSQLKKLTNKKFDKEKTELGIDLGDFNTALDLTQQIQSLFNLGSHTLLSKFLNALQVTQQIVALLQSLQLAQGIFSFISKIFGFALAPLTGGASAAGAVAGMPSGSSGGNLPDRYGQVINYINTNLTKVSKEPYFVSLKADGRELKAVIKQVDKIDDNRLK
jgi:precorrin isomerase